MIDEFILYEDLRIGPKLFISNRAKKKFVIFGDGPATDFRVLLTSVSSRPPPAGHHIVFLATVRFHRLLISLDFSFIWTTTTGRHIVFLATVCFHRLLNYVYFSFI
ncbi:hypothetical protein Hanom_Chr07g00666691 [Helianthus anomalus]